MVNRLCYTPEIERYAENNRLMTVARQSTRGGTLRTEELHMPTVLENK